MPSITGMPIFYEQRVSTAEALRLIAEIFPGQDKQIPRAGRELVLADKKDPVYGLGLELTLGNYGDRLVVASCTTKAQDWKKVFGIEVRAPKPHHPSMQAQFMSCASSL